FQTHNGPKSALPDRLLIERSTCNSLAAKNLRVYADDQNLLVIGSVEYADSSSFRQVARGPPQKIVLQFHRAGVLIAEYLATLRVDPGHHVPDRAIFPRSVHRLKYQQDGIAI